jgi:hypothetical protein
MRLETTPLAVLKGRDAADMTVWEVDAGLEWLEVKLRLETWWLL